MADARYASVPQDELQYEYEQHQPPQQTDTSYPMERESSPAETKRKTQNLGVAISWAFYLVTWMAGCLSFGVALWIVIDRNFYSEIFGTTLLEVSAYMQTVCGGIAIVFSIVGCVGGVAKSRLILQIHFVAIILASAGLLTSGFLAVAYKVDVDKNPEQDKSHMRNVITYSYGVNLENGYNRRVTDSWDTTQARLWCCAVEDESWSLYRGSSWFALQPGLIEYDKTLVPASCCVTDQYGQYTSLQKCQTWPSGPPTKAGEPNESLHYRGCHGAIREFARRHSSYLIGVGISSGLVMIPDVLVTLWLFMVVIPKETAAQAQVMKSTFAGLYK